MSYQDVVTAEGLGFLGLLAAILFVRFLTNHINAHWLLFGRAGPSHVLTATRVQLLVATLAGAIAYLSEAFGHARGGAMPPVPAAWVDFLGASNGLYLASKAYNNLVVNRPGKSRRGQP
jgi:hypothetical protein